MRSRTIVIVLLILWGAFVVVEIAAARQWKDKRGRSINAEFVRLANGVVVLKRGSRVTTVRLRDLCREDQAYVRQLSGEDVVDSSAPATVVTGEWSIMGERRARGWNNRNQAVSGTIERIEDGHVVVRTDSVSVDLKSEVLMVPYQSFSALDRCYLLKEFRREFATRAWTDASGKFSVEAELVKIDEGKAVFEKKDGSQVAVDIARLSAADKDYIKNNLDLSFAGITERPWTDSQGSIYRIFDDETKWFAEKHAWLGDGIIVQEEFLKLGKGEPRPKTLNAPRSLRFKLQWSEELGVVAVNLESSELMPIRKLTDSELAEFKERERAGISLVSPAAVEAGLAPLRAKWQKKKHEALEEAAGLLAEKPKPVQGILHQTDMMATISLIQGELAKLEDPNHIVAFEAKAALERKLSAIGGQRIVWGLPVTFVSVRGVGSVPAVYVLATTGGNVRLQRSGQPAKPDPYVVAPAQIPIFYGYVLDHPVPDTDKETAKRLKQGDIVVITARVDGTRFSEGMELFGVMPEVSIFLDELFVISTSVDQ